MKYKDEKLLYKKGRTQEILCKCCIEFRKFKKIPNLKNVNFESRIQREPQLGKSGLTLKNKRRFQI